MEGEEFLCGNFWDNQKNITIYTKEKKYKNIPTKPYFEIGYLLQELDYIYITQVRNQKYFNLLEQDYKKFIDRFTSKKGQEEKIKYMIYIKSYILTLHNIEKLVKKLVKNMEEYQTKFCKNINKLDNKDIKIVKIRRNKIFGHIAYGEPYDEDNNSMQETTLAIATAKIIGFTKDGFKLGGESTIKVNGEKINKDIPEISIIKLHKEITYPYITSIYIHFTDMIDEIYKTSNDKLRVLDKNINEITRN